MSVLKAVIANDVHQLVDVDADGRLVLNLLPGLFRSEADHLPSFAALKFDIAKLHLRRERRVVLRDRLNCERRLLRFRACG